MTRKSKIAVVYLRTGYLETVDDAWAYPTYDTERLFPSDTVFFKGKDVLALLRSIESDANLRSAIEDVEDFIGE